MGVNWGTQNRAADGTAWAFAIRRHWGHTLVGMVWGGLIWWLDRPAFWWFIPVLAGMVLSIPLSVFTSRSSLGEHARKLGLLLTPEETTPPSEIASLLERMAALEKSGETAPRPANVGLADAVLDPYVNAIHVTLLREKRLNPIYADTLTKLGVGQPEVAALGEKLLADGPDALMPPEKLLVMADADVMLWLHHQSWLRPSASLAAWWQTAIRQYAR
jgi:membrane glycosyltransferase